ncbi:hypothetical protein L7F22_018508 [Adiantum nelumboides]|nr:hypothetical protein [Adiantum nelumboides]
MFANAFKNVVDVALETYYSFLKATKIKKYLKDPSKIAVLGCPNINFDTLALASVAMDEKKRELEEEYDDDMGFSLSD